MDQLLPPMTPGLLVLSLLLAPAAGGVARAQTSETGGPAEEPAEAFELPRAPDELDPLLAVEVHVAAVFPVARRPLCPPGSACVFAGGGGVGAGIERRWPTGVALGLAYDAWFLDSNSLYELGVMQMLSARLRYYFLPDGVLHPFVTGAVGALIFGDTLRIATVGVAVEPSVGAEIELTESIGLTAALPWRFFTTSPFQTTRDRVDRAEDPGVNVAVSFQLGLVIVDTP